MPVLCLLQFQFNAEMYRVFSRVAWQEFPELDFKFFALWLCGGREATAIHLVKGKKFYCPGICDDFCSKLFTIHDDSLCPFHDSLHLCGEK